MLSVLWAQGARTPFEEVARAGRSRVGLGTRGSAWALGRAVGGGGDRVRGTQEERVLRHLEFGAARALKGSGGGWHGASAWAAGVGWEGRKRAPAAEVLQPSSGSG